AVGLDPTGNVVALVDEQGRLLLQEVGGGRVIDVLTATYPAGFRCPAVSLSRGGDLVAVCDERLLTLWSPKSGRPTKRMGTSCSAVAVLDDEHVITGDATGRLRLIHVDRGLIGLAHHHHQGIISIAASPKGVLVGSSEPGALLYSAFPKLEPPRVCARCAARGVPASLVIHELTTQ
ncbi:MAG: hypothetical protein RIF41_03155, partial [Polyangiaceae bacterium]